MTTGKSEYINAVGVKPKNIMFLMAIRITARHSEKCASVRIQKKRMPFCNEMDRGSKFALTRKCAHVCKVSRCTRIVEFSNLEIA